MFVIPLALKAQENVTSSHENPNEEFNSFHKSFKSSVDYNAPLIN